MQRRRVVITLPIPDYRRLQDLASREERAVDQQASFVLRQALASTRTAQKQEADTNALAAIG